MKTATSTVSDRPLDRPAIASHAGLRGVLGEAAWTRLPATVRARFAEPARTVDYVGRFEVVRASKVGRVIAWCTRLLGTPVVAAVGRDVPAVVHVGPRGGGVAWHREYRWPDGTVSLVRSTKTIDRRGALVERLPARLCMPLDTFERGGTLHFVSRGYYFDLSSDWLRRLAWQHEWHLPLPTFLAPGVTHVEHIDEADGWFRFTMTVTHPLLGEMFYQTGRFKAAEQNS
jgi:Domain of unknown function (DUF4166)